MKKYFLRTSGLRASYRLFGVPSYIFLAVRRENTGSLFDPTLSGRV